VLVQLVSLLNDEFGAEEGTELACGVLRTLAALLAGNDSARKRLSHDVGECYRAPHPHKPATRQRCAWHRRLLRWPTTCTALHSFDLKRLTFVSYCRSCFVPAV
jgi:hypothetical protein